MSTDAPLSTSDAASGTPPVHGPLPALGPVGLWTFGLDFAPIPVLRDTVAEIDELGYPALWLPEAVGREAFTQSLLVLESSRRLVAATGIANLWARDAMAANAATRTLVDAHPGRFLFGLGVSHAPLVEGLRTGTAGSYHRPLQVTADYLTRLDNALYLAHGNDTPRPPRVLGALGPRMLELARDRAEGAHTYLVTPEHTALARETLGTDGTRLLAVEMAVVLTRDRDTALRRARAGLAQYLDLPNYRNNWLRLGLDEGDFADGGSTRLLERLVAFGDEDTIRARVHEHLKAGADHVCVQVLGERMSDLPLAEWRALAPALLE